MLARRLSYLLVACSLLALLAGLGGHVAAQGGGASLVLKFPAVKDFGGVSAKVLYLRQDLPESMPLRFVSDRVEAVPGFFPAGTCVSVLSAGTRLGSAVAGEDGLLVPVPPPPVEGALEVVESDQPVPLSRMCIKVKLTGGGAAHVQQEQPVVSAARHGADAACSRDR